MDEATLKKQDEEFERNAEAYADGVSSTAPSAKAPAKSVLMESLRILPDDPPDVVRMKMTGIQSALQFERAWAAGENMLEYGLKKFTGFTNRPVPRQESKMRKRG